MPNGLPKEIPKSLKICKNREKSSTKCLPGGYFTLTLKKHEKVIKFMDIREGLYAIRTRLCSRNTLFPFPTFPQKCIENTSKMFPLGHLLGSFGHLNASTCRFLCVFGAAKQIMFFWKAPGCTYYCKMLAKWVGFASTFWALFGTFSYQVPPIYKSTQKVVLFSKKHT